MDSPLLSRRTALASAAALAVVGLQTRNASATSGYPDEIALPRGFRPEGITTYGPLFAAGSMADGRILVGDLRSGRTGVLFPGGPGRMVRGLAYDARSRLLWAVGNVDTTAHVAAVDTRSGTLAVDLVVAGGLFLNDVTIDGRGVWVTDSRVDRLTHIPLDRRGRPASTAAAFLPLSGEWPQGDGKANNANGIRGLPDGSSLVLNNSAVGGLWQVDERTGRVRQIAVTGAPALVGGDGLERSGSTLFDVRGSDNGSVTQLALSRSGPRWSAAVTGRLTSPRLDVPSTASAALGALYAVNARFGVASPETADYWVTRLPLS